MCVGGGGFRVGSVVKNLSANAGDIRDLGSILGWEDPLEEEMAIPFSILSPWRRKWQSTPIFFPGESHRQRNLVGYSPWGHEELDTTKETLHAHTCVFLTAKVNLRQYLLLFFILHPFN